MQSLPLSLGLTNGSGPARFFPNPAPWADSNPLSTEAEGWGGEAGRAGVEEMHGWGGKNVGMA